MSEHNFWSVIRKPHIVRTALRVSLFVGTILNLINQGEQLLAGSGIDWGHALLNYVVPYCVASYSAARNELGRTRETQP